MQIPTSLSLLAQAAPPEAASPFNMVDLIFFGVIMVVVWWLLIRPATQQARAHEALLKGLAVGTQVVTQGGLIGKVVKVSEKVVTLELARDMKVRVVKSQITGRFEAEGEGEA